MISNRGLRVQLLSLTLPYAAGLVAFFTDPTRRGFSFEGFYLWTVDRRAYRKDEWKGVNECNPAISSTPAQSNLRLMKSLGRPVASPAEMFQVEPGDYAVRLNNQVTWVKLTPPD